jgi:hypothetical protein
MKILLGALLLLTATSYAGSVRLLNDSPYVLRAVIRGNDGSFLGEMVVNPQYGTTWTDTSLNMLQRSPRSRTPFTVLWYCMDGNTFSISTDVGSASTVTAQGGDGARICRPPVPPAPSAPAPEGQYLHPAPGEKPGQNPEDQPPLRGY